jgi:hypothetical protein
VGARVVAALALSAMPASGCGSVGPSPSGPKPTASAPSAASVPKVAPQYVLSGEALRGATRLPLPGGASGVLQASTRLVLDPYGEVTATAARTESLSRVSAIPAWLGGGFLFQTSDALFRAHEFLGDLEPLTSSASGFSSITFGPSSALVVTGDGVRFALDLGTGKRSRVEPRGAATFGSVSKDRGLAIVDGGFAYLTGDGGKTWKRLGPELLGAPREIVVNEAEIGRRVVYLVEDNGGALVLGETSLDRATTGPKNRTPEQPLSSRGEPFLDLAIRAGAPLDSVDAPTQAIVPDAGSLYTVSLETGAIVSVENGALPPDVPCEAERLSNELLFLCRQGSRAVVASRPLLGGKVILEASFRTSGTFVRGGGDALLFTGPCRGDTAKLGQACLRVPRSDSVERAPWADVDRSAELSDADPRKPVTIVTWVPGDRGAVAVLGGAEGGLLDTRAHTRTRLSEEESRKLSAALQPSGSEIVERRFRLLEDGAIEGWTPSGEGVRVTDGGKTITLSAFAFPTLRTNGSRRRASSGRATIGDRRSSRWRPPSARRRRRHPARAGRSDVTWASGCASDGRPSLPKPPSPSRLPRAAWCPPSRRRGCQRCRARSRDRSSATRSPRRRAVAWGSARRPSPPVITGPSYASRSVDRSQARPGRTPPRSARSSRRSSPRWARAARCASTSPAPIGRSRSSRRSIPRRRRSGPRSRSTRSSPR